ncbi:glutamine cyclotransferase [Orrella sp. JC864]|uniref:Vgb family protein n=1 Tax=Orrella sp. JC864 TaxID=3120298 RepID=UPI00300B91C3
MKSSPAQIIQEYGPFPGVDAVHGVTYDGRQVWFATGDKLCALDPASATVQRSLPLTANAGTACDGAHLFQIADDRIHKIDPQSGRVLAAIPAPCADCSGLAWGEGALWVGGYKGRNIYQVDPETGQVLRTLACERFVTGVSWFGAELWHGTWEDGQSDLRQIDPQTGKVLQRLEMPEGMGVSGLEGDGRDRFYCGGGGSGRLRVVRKPA